LSGYPFCPLRVDIRYRGQGGFLRVRVLLRMEFSEIADADDGGRDFRWLIQRPCLPVSNRNYGDPEIIRCFEQHIFL
jgi:hypothetical protein